MMFNFLKIKIYRHKFIAYVIFYITLGVVLCLLTCSYLVRNWTMEAQAKAVSAFETAEINFKSATNKADAYTQRIYSGSELMKDVQYLAGKDAEGYLTARLANSSYDRLLTSFPEDIYSYLEGTAIKSVVLHTEECDNVLNINGKTATRIEFCQSPEAFAENQGIENGFYYRQKLSDPEDISHTIAELWFLIDSEKIFGNIGDASFLDVMVEGVKGEIYLLKGTKGNLEPILAQQQPSGWTTENLFNRQQFSLFTSTQFDYRLLITYDQWNSIQTHVGSIVFVAVVFFVSLLCIILFTMYNLWYDAHFLNHIIGLIDRVKVGDFSRVNSPKNRRDEYGMIATELDDMSQKLDQYIRTEYLLKLQQQSAEMKALQQQINPHFLYNTLEIIRSSALVNNDSTTAKAISNLGGLYRLIVKERDVLTFADEIEILKKYLGIMEAKYSGNFYYQVDVAPEVLKQKTIKLWLQPLAENFFVHGYNRTAEANVLVVSVEEETDYFVVRLTDNGQGMTQESLQQLKQMLNDAEQMKEADVALQQNNASIGIQNVYLRLRFFYGHRCVMSIERNEEAGVEVTVMIPKEDEIHVPDADC